MHLYKTRHFIKAIKLIDGVIVFVSDPNALTHSLTTHFFFPFQELQKPVEGGEVLESDDSFLDNLIFNSQALDPSSSSSTGASSTTTGRTKVPRPTSDHELRQGSVTGTPKPPTTELDDIFISVKTTKNYHDSRLSLIIKTWFQLAKSQVSRRHPL